MKEGEKNLVLLFGATGKSGFHIANRLWQSENYPVRIVVRSKDKALKLFKQKQVAFESIIQGELSDQEILKKAFAPSEHYGNVKIVISALGASGSNSEPNVQKVQTTDLVRIIHTSKQKNVQRFLLITAAFMQRPWSPIPVLISSFVPNVYHYKTMTQNALRNSGLDYIIVRPPQLRGNFDDKKITSYGLSQGDKTSGYISRSTLSNVVFDALNSKNLPKKVTFQCYATKQPQKQQLFSQLKPDTQKSIVKANHKLAKRTYWTFLALGFAATAFYFYDKYFNPKPVIPL